MSESKCVWAGGHGGLRLAAYSDGTAEARSGDGVLLVAVSAGCPGVDKARFGVIVDVLRGYAANPAELGMLGDALAEARSALEKEVGK